ncbi:MAG: hypothetical protein ABF271_13905 [Abyssibacter sp.]|uniref:DUF6918 family protein n=1 Tax=Abyssibacter sp. TaxID=2320200 RepID=UPI002EBA821B|nr:hypothetical protein [Pseudomonadota bacterium]
MQLADILLAEDYRDTVVAQITQVVEDQIAQRKGLSGAGIRTALKMAKANRPDILPVVINRLLPDFCNALEPYFQQFQASDETDFQRFVTRQEDEIQEAMLSVTDARAEHSQNKTFKKMYRQLRGTAGQEVRAILPKLSALVQARLPA